MIPVTWNPDEQNAVGPYERKRSSRARALALFLSVAAFLVAVILAVVLFVPSVHSSAVGVEGSPDFELRDYLIDNRLIVNRAEWIER